MADTGEAGVRLDGVSVAFGDVQALSDVSLRVADGEFFTVVGPSGCGKTTALRTIAGFETPEQGTVSIDGSVVTEAPPERRDTGVVFQNYALFPHMSVAENVAYGLRYRDPPEGRDTAARVAELLELVDMDGMGDRDPTALSGGQQQRVALARALAPSPTVLLLDEPLSALDARLRQRLRVRIREIQRELGITTVYVTHDQAEALAISDRIAVVRDGRVEQVGTPEAVYRQPRTRFVAAFVGENNVFDAEVVATGSTAESIATETTAESIATETTAESTPRVSLAGETITLSGPDDDSAADREPVTDEVVSGDGVVVCVRPEDIRIGGGDVTVTARVDHVEFLGDAYRVHCAWNDRTLLAKTRTDPRREDAGAGEATVQLGFDASDVTVVTTETGDARP